MRNINKAHVLNKIYDLIKRGISVAAVIGYSSDTYSSGLAKIMMVNFSYRDIKLIFSPCDQAFQHTAFFFKALRIVYKEIYFNSSGNHITLRL